MCSRMRTMLAAYKGPTIVEFVDVLPRNATGKVRKDVLREGFRRSSDRPAGIV